MFRKITKFGLAAVALIGASSAHGDTVSCLYDCQKAYDACLKTPATIAECLKRLTECKGRCAAQPE